MRSSASSLTSTSRQRPISKSSSLHPQMMIMRKQKPSRLFHWATATRMRKRSVITWHEWKTQKRIDTGFLRSFPSITLRRTLESPKSFACEWWSGRKIRTWEVFCITLPWLKQTFLWALHASLSSTSFWTSLATSEPTISERSFVTLMSSLYEKLG